MDRGHALRGSPMVPRLLGRDAKSMSRRHPSCTTDRRRPQPRPTLAALDMPRAGLRAVTTVRGAVDAEMVGDQDRAVRAEDGEIEPGDVRQSQAGLLPRGSAVVRAVDEGFREQGIVVDGIEPIGRRGIELDLRVPGERTSSLDRVARPMQPAILASPELGPCRAMDHVRIERVEREVMSVEQGEIHRILMPGSRVIGGAIAADSIAEDQAVDER